MHKIDIHTHILPPDIPKFKDIFGYDSNFIELVHKGDEKADMIRNGNLFRTIDRSCYCTKRRIEECNDRDIDIQVISTIPVMFNYHIKAKDGLYIAKFINDHIAKSVNEHPKRFIGLGTLPMQDTKLAIEELERVINQLKLKGIQIGTHINNWNLNDPQVFEVLRACESLGAAVFVHPWDMMGQDRMKKYWLPWLVGMPAESSLAICSAIFGEYLKNYQTLELLLPTEEVHLHLL